MTLGIDQCSTRKLRRRLQFHDNQSVLLTSCPSTERLSSLTRDRHGFSITVELHTDAGEFLLIQALNEWIAERDITILVLRMRGNMEDGGEPDVQQQISQRWKFVKSRS